MDGTILLADDDRTIRTVLTQALTRAGCKVHATGSIETLLGWVAEGRGDMVISDVVMPDGNGLQALPRITQLRPDLPVIIISAQNTIVTAIRATEAAAFDYLPKPFDLPDLMRRVARALETKRHRTPPLVAPVATDQPEGQEVALVGRSAGMQALYRLVARIMNTDLPVMISGESGTGKSMVARVLHDLSDRRDQPFVIAESADFASTEAAQNLLQKVGNGSLLFEDIGEYDDIYQGRIVRFLDGLPKGDRAPRLISTLQSTAGQPASGNGLRPDLFYRLNGVSIAVPPLRERVEDISLLAEHFLARSARPGQVPHRISDEGLDLLRAQSWHGNVRHLENLVRRLAATAGDSVIGRGEIESALGAAPGHSAPFEDGERLAESVSRHLTRYFDLHMGSLPPPGLYDRILREIEVPLIEIALEATGGNQAKCADLLGINRNTLRKKVTELDIRVTRRRKLM